MQAKSWNRETVKKTENLGQQFLFICVFCDIFRFDHNWHRFWPQATKDVEIALDPRGFIVIGNYTAASTKDNDKPALEFLRQLSTYIMLSLSVFSCDISRSTAFCNFSFHKTSDFLFMKDLNHIIISNVQPSGNMRTLG